MPCFQSNSGQVLRKLGFCLTQVWFLRMPFTLFPYIALELMSLTVKLDEGGQNNMESSMSLQWNERFPLWTTPVSIAPIFELNVKPFFIIIFITAVSRNGCYQEIWVFKTSPMIDAKHKKGRSNWAQPIQADKFDQAPGRLENPSGSTFESLESTHVFGREEIHVQSSQYSSRTRKFL